MVSDQAKMREKPEEEEEKPNRDKDIAVVGMNGQFEGERGNFPPFLHPSVNGEELGKNFGKNHAAENEIRDNLYVINIAWQLQLKPCFGEGVEKLWTARCEL